MTTNGAIKTVTTTVNYDILGPDEIYKIATASLYQNRPCDTKSVTVSDIRPHSSGFTLDGQGFELHKHNIDFHDFSDNDKVESEWWPAVADFLKSKTGATKAIPFSHLIRNQPYSAAEEASKNADPDQSVTVLNPARWVHIDQSRDGALILLKDVLKDSWLQLSKTRWGIINVWRPISPVVRKDPLGFVDGSTVDPDDLVPKDVKYPVARKNVSTTTSGAVVHRVCGVKSSPKHKWYYVNEMSNEEVLLIKIFDSKEDGRVREVPHTSFVDEEWENEKENRESIETRCLVFWEDQDAE
ncbi:hypothetical protein NA57DRAFT_61265 [Rhizodiscina lignyota]|uniref:Uncharacterized protein n=1 Tax=Rhizodiscina lignyota TaxID=1504668 RepID=A0A9P4I6Y0_9PEZI|nr:hypothetical protein NA57DRAFT_61265 [Rhizodiscina lignyota]